MHEGTCRGGVQHQINSRSVALFSVDYGSTIRITPTFKKNIAMYMNDTMRVEMSIPAHMMLAVLLSGANCADPGPAPGNHWSPTTKAAIEKWKADWAEHNHKVETDPEFARSYETFRQTKQLLLEACNEALKGVYPPQKELSLLRRIERVHREVVEPFITTDKPDPRKIGIVAYYLLQHLVDTELLIVPEESSFGQALDNMLPALSPQANSSPEEDAEYEALNRSAQKQVCRILQKLQTEGYYKGIPLPDFH